MAAMRAMAHGSLRARHSVPSAVADGRRVFRQPVRMQATLRKPGLTKFDIEVRDLSPFGLRAATSFTLKPGAVVWLALPGLAGIEAEVAWCRSYEYGFRFKQPLHSAVFDHIARSAATE